MEKELTNSEKIHKQLSKLSYTIYENYFSHVRDELDYINANIQLSESKDAVLFSTLFIELFELSIKEEYFWRYCDFKTYRNKYNKRLNEFIKEYGPDVSEVDFIDSEKEIIEKGFLSYSFSIDDYPFDRAAIEISFLDQKIQKRLTYSKGRKLNYLESELKRIEKHQELYADYDEKILPPNYIRDIKNRNEILAGFITSADSDKKLELLPYNDFLNKYNQLTERGQIAFLSELKRIISNGAISKAYLLKEWKDINLKSFVNSQLDSISRINDLEVEIQQNNKINKATLIETEQENSPYSEYRNFWTPLLSTNSKSGEPYMTEENFTIFIENIIDDNNDIKQITWPGFSKAELQHGAALFISRFRFNKWDMVRILMNTFPKIFNKNKEDEYTNIRVRYNTKRLFK